MHSRTLTLAIFGLVCLVQLGVPLAMIQRRELALRDGSVHRFRTAPVDPYDAFRGRYVALQFAEDALDIPAATTYYRNEKVYAVLVRDEDGFTRIDGLSRKRPAQGEYLTVRVRWETQGETVRVRLPFDRYYMNEKLAPEAERLYRTRRQADERPAYVTVRVKRGFGVLEELYVDGKPITELVLAEQRKAGD